MFGKHFRFLLFAAILTATCLFSHPAAAQLRLGGFDTTRGGIESFDAGGSMTTLRANIQSSFPGVLFSSTNTLTAGFLAGIDVLLIGAGTGPNSAITPLSAAEQTALLNFVQSGKGAVLFTDNDTFAGAASTPANNSLLAAFGLTATGTFNGTQNVTVPSPAGNPISNGPFGLVTAYSSFFTGFFNNLGPNAVSLATLDANGQPALASIGKGVLGAGSGGVVAFSDSSLLLDGFITAADSTIIRNAIAFAQPTASAAPEPGTLALFTCLPGMLLIARRRRNIW